MLPKWVNQVFPASSPRIRKSCLCASGHGPAGAEREVVRGRPVRRARFQADPGQEQEQEEWQQEQYGGAFFHKGLRMIFSNMINWYKNYNRIGSLPEKIVMYFGGTDQYGEMAVVE